MAAKAAAKMALQLTPAQIRQILRLAGKTYKGKKAPKLTSGAMRKARKPGAAAKLARDKKLAKLSPAYGRRVKAQRDRRLSKISPAYGRRVQAQKTARKRRK